MHAPDESTETFAPSAQQIQEAGQEVPERRKRRRASNSIPELAPESAGGRNSEPFVNPDDADKSEWNGAAAVNELGDDGHFHYCSTCGSSDKRLLLCEG